MTGLLVKLARGEYRVGAYVVLYDGGEGGTRQWVIVRDTPGGNDSPLAFCRTLKQARELIEAHAKVPVS